MTSLWTDTFADRVEEAFGVMVPPAYRDFLSESAVDLEARTLILEDGFVRGQFSVDFGDRDLLDTKALGEACWIDDMYEVDWPEIFADFVPFARLFDEGADDEEEFVEPVRAFLVLQVTDPDGPIWLWDYEGWRVYPLAASLTDFVDGRAWQEKTPLEHSKASYAYSAFSWSNSQ